MDWEQEVRALHDVFEEWFRGQGAEELLQRMDDAFHPDLSYIGPDGSQLMRGELLAGLSDMRGSMPSISITVSDFREALRTEGLVLGVYNETHRKDDEITVRTTTAVFEVDEAAPHGVRWRHVHETWME